jgi:hypothetical protein
VHFNIQKLKRRFNTRAQRKFQRTYHYALKRAKHTPHDMYEIQGLTHSALGRYGRFCVRFCLWYLHSWIRTTKKPSSRYLHPHGNVTVSDATLPSQALYYIHPDHIFKPSSRTDSQQQQQLHLTTSARRIIQP